MDNPTPVAEPARHKRHLRNYLVDKKLQLRYIGVVTLLSAGICGLLGYLIVDQQREASATIMKSVEGTDWLPSETKDEIRDHLRSGDTTALVTMGGVCLGLIAVLSMFLIVMTHKAAGPLHKIGTYFDQIKDGKLPTLYELRRADQFQDFFHKFKRMTETLRERGDHDIVLCKRFLNVCEAANVPETGEVGHALDELRKLVQEKQTFLG